MTPFITHAITSIQSKRRAYITTHPSSFTSERDKEVYMKGGWTVVVITTTTTTTTTIIIIIINITITTITTIIIIITTAPLIARPLSPI